MTFPLFHYFKYKTSISHLKIVSETFEFIKKIDKMFHIWFLELKKESLENYKKLLTELIWQQ